MEFVFGDLDDDLFDNTERQLENNLEEQIKSYKARQVDFEVCVYAYLDLVQKNLNFILILS